MIDLIQIFSALESENYTIIKLSEEFPIYRTGSDIDVLCLNPESISKIILQIGNQYLDKGYEILVNDDSNKIYIDFIKDQKIDFRFDLYKELPKYKRINIKSALFESIIENSVPKKIKNKINVFVPSLVDELVIRYIEYHEWYGSRPDKIKHINYINEFISDPNTKHKFLNKLHHYTALQRIYEDEHEEQSNQNKITLTRVYLKKMVSARMFNFLSIPYHTFRFVARNFFKK